MAADALVSDVARSLSPEGVEVMPLKGAFLQHWLYEDPSLRPMTDVDLLVRETDFAVVRAILIGNGYRPTTLSNVGGGVFETRFGLALDLHTRLFGRLRYRLSTDDVFRRSRLDVATFDVPVRVPSRLDAYAHSIGKAGSDHIDITADARLDEIARLGCALAADHDAVAAHLVSCGMRRVTRYVLSLVHRAHGDPRSVGVLRALPSDRVGALLVDTASAIVASTSQQSSARPLMAHLLNDSLLRGIGSGVVALTKREIARTSGR